MHQKRTWILVAMGVISVAVLGQVLADQKGKSGPLPSGDVLGFVGKGGRPMALEQTFPGLIGALMLTDEQKQKIQEARDEIFGSEAVQAAGRKGKLDPNATEADKEAARSAMEEARRKLEAKVSNILTADQRALVTRINTAAEEVQKAVRDSLEQQFVAAKGNDNLREELQKQSREKLVTEMASKLAGVLTADQHAAYLKAAEEQKAATAEKAKNSKLK